MRLCEISELGAELTNSFCRTDPAIARQFARVTFLSDNRADLPQVRVRSLILQCAEDDRRDPALSVAAPPAVSDQEGSPSPVQPSLLEESVEDLYENAPCGYLSALPGGTIVKVNQTFLAWTGYRREDLVGHRRFDELLTAGAAYVRRDVQ